MIDDAVLTAARAHAEQEQPKESCGLVVSIAGEQSYIQCANSASNPENNFHISPQDWCKAEDKGEVVAIVHSHPGASSRPSQADKIAAEQHGLPWLILGDDGHTIYKPNGQSMPLLGRTFIHGVLDCYTAVKDFYKRELGIELGDYERKGGWWREQGASLYADNVESEGFEQVEDLRYGDMLLMRIGRTRHINHAAIYLGEDALLKSEEAPRLYGQGPFFYHHMYGRNSSREVYGHSWFNRTEKIMRHKNLMRQQ